MGPLIDFDNHYYETPDAFTRYQPGELADRGVRWVTTDDGKRRILVGDRLLRFIVNPTFEPIGEPGALQPYLEGHRRADGSPWKDIDLGPQHPAYRDRSARVQMMDGQGVEKAVMYPTLAVVVEELLAHDTPLTYAVLHAFNRWLDDEWGFDRDGRIYAVPLISLLDTPAAVAELDWALERGARVVHVRAGPAGGRSPADPALDPFWTRIHEARIVVAFHGADDGYLGWYEQLWGERANAPAHRITPFQHMVAFPDRAIFDTLAALVCHGLFHRFPAVRVASVEMGSEWLPYFARKLARTARKVGTASSGPALLEQFREHVYVCPFPEEDFREAAEVLGPKHVLFGSDWPHAEGLAEPADIGTRLSDLSAADRSSIIHDNAARLLAG